MVDCIVCGSWTRETSIRWGHRFRTCVGCRLEFVHPQPDDGTLDRIYGESYYDAWGIRAIEPTVRRMKRSTFRRYLRRLGPPGAGARLAECGAATGYLAELAAEMGWDPYAIEISEFGAAACARVLGADRVFRGQVEASRFAANPSGRFEAVTMIDFLEHVRDPRSVLRWAAEHLVPGGQILLVTPRAGSVTHRRMGRAWPHYKLEHLWYFNPGNLLRLLREAGFTHARVRPADKTLTPAYAAAYFERYRHPVLTPLVKGALALFPSFVRELPVPVTFGEMLLTLKTGREAGDPGPGAPVREPGAPGRSGGRSGPSPAAAVTRKGG